MSDESGDETESAGTRGRTAVERSGPAVRGLRLGVNLLLILVVGAGASYLLLGDEDGSLEQPEAASGATAIQTQNPPMPTLRTTQDGVRVAGFDPQALRRWCEAMGFAEVLLFESLEPAIAESLASAFATVSTAGHAASFGRLGQVLASLECNSAATRCFELAAQADAGDFRWPYYAGWLAQLDGRTSQAIDLLERALSLNVKYAMTYCRLGQAYWEADRLDDAAASFRRYSELHPADTIGYVGMARVAVGRQAWEQALQHLQASLANGGSQDFYTHYYLARTHAALGQDELARQHSDLAKEPPKADWLFKYDPLLTSLGSASGSQIPALEAELARLQHSRDWPRLARVSAQIIEYRQGSITMMANLAMYYRFMGRHADAHRVLDRAMALRPESPMLQARRAETHLADQKLEQALASADAALAHQPTGDVAFTAQQARGRALFMMRRYEPAEQALREAVSLQPQNPAANFFLGETLQARRKPNEAAQYYRKVLELFPGNQAAKRKLDEVTGTSN